MKVQMKPETIVRRAVKRRQDIADRRALLIARLEANVAEYGPDSIYAEMLQDMKERQQKTLDALS